MVLFILFAGDNGNIYKSNSQGNISSVSKSWLFATTAKVNGTNIIGSGGLNTVSFGFQTEIHDGSDITINASLIEINTIGVYEFNLTASYANQGGNRTSLRTYISGGVQPDFLIIR